jgi:hypothetical protein
MAVAVVRCAFRGAAGAGEELIVDALYVREWTSLSPKQEIENKENNSCDTPRRVANSSGQ